MNQTLSGAIGGTGPLTINSTGGSATDRGLWNLNAASNYTGNTIIKNGSGLKDITAKLGIANALPTTTSLNLTGATNTANAFATLDLNGFGQELAGLTDSGSSSFVASFGKRVINSSATLATLTLNIASGTNTYGTTGTRITRGTITGTANGQTMPASVTLNNGTMSGTFKSDFGTFLSGGVSGTTITANGVTNPVNAGNIGMASALTVNTPLAGDALAISSQLGEASVLGGGLTKNGLGTLTLSGSNTYTGGTTVSAGKLAIASVGTINTTSGVSIGAGELNYNNSSTALTIAPTFSGGITYNTGSIFEWNLTANTDIAVGTRGTNYDAVNTASLGVTTGAIFRVILNGSESFRESFWNADHTWAGLFNNLAESSAYDLSTIFNGGFEYQNSAGTVTGVTGSEGAFSFISIAARI